jgi:hypothetical protein
MCRRQSDQCPQQVGWSSESFFHLAYLNCNSTLPQQQQQLRLAVPEWHMNAPSPAIGIVAAVARQGTLLSTTEIW